MLTAFSDLVSTIRSKVLSNRATIRFLSDFPLTRPIARRESRAAFDLCAGFVYSQVLMACIELGLLDHLAAKPLSLADLAARMKLDERAAERLLLAAARLRLVSRRSHDRYGLGQLGSVIQSNHGLQQMIAHHAILYRDLADPVALLRQQQATTGMRRFWAYSQNTNPAAVQPQDAAEYSRLMAASVTSVAQDILDAYPLDGCTSLLDAGGGDGSFALAAARRISGLRTTTLDLPAVAALATEQFTAAGMTARCRAIAGNMLSDEPTEQYDVVTLVRILIDHDAPSVLRILRYCYRSLKPGGTLLIAEPRSDAPGFERVGDVYFAFYLLAMGQGRARSFDELSDLLSVSGFARPRRIATRMPLVAGLIAADHKQSVTIS